MQGIQFGWPQIIRLGMVQAALGAILVLMTSTLNRIMVVELMLPALVPAPEQSGSRPSRRDA